MLPETFLFCFAFSNLRSSLTRPHATHRQADRTPSAIAYFSLSHTHNKTSSVLLSSVSYLDRSTSKYSSFHLPIQPKSPVVHAFGDAISGYRSWTHFNPTARNLRRVYL